MKSKDLLLDVFMAEELGWVWWERESDRSGWLFPPDTQTYKSQTISFMGSVVGDLNPCKDSKKHLELVSRGKISPFGVTNVPKWGEDLNAMHEAQATLSREPKDGEYSEYTKYCIELEKLCSGLPYDATAEQRREAFLRVKGRYGND